MVNRQRLEVYGLIRQGSLASFLLGIKIWELQATLLEMQRLYGGGEQSLQDLRRYLVVLTDTSSRNEVIEALLDTHRLALRQMTALLEGVAEICWDTGTLGDLGLDFRTYNILTLQGLQTVQDLVEYIHLLWEEEQKTLMDRLDGIGSIRQGRISESLRKRGHSLPESYTQRLSPWDDRLLLDLKLLGFDIQMSGIID